MKKHIFVVCAILASVACPASLQAAVTEEYKSVEAINVEQAIQQDASLNQAAVSSAAPTSQNVVIEQPMLIASRPSQDVYLETTIADKPVKGEKTVGITPMLGGAIYSGAWGANTRNQYGLGLALEFPLSPYFAFELEGGYNNYKVAYTPNVAGAGAVGHDFNLFLLGGNGKIYLTRTKLRPFIGAGLTGMIYDQMYGLTQTTGVGMYTTAIGAANILFGLDLAVSETVSFGARAQYLVPVLNRPLSGAVVSPYMGLTSAPGVEEAALINNSLWRVMGTMTIRL